MWPIESRKNYSLSESESESKIVKKLSELLSRKSVRKWLMLHLL